jgi:hypothetical protein
MNTALIMLQSDDIAGRLATSLDDEGFATARADTPDQLLAAMRDSAPALALAEVRREAFVYLLRAMLRLQPGTSVYLIEGNAVFCRWPMRAHQPGIARAIRSGGLRLSDRLLWPAAVASGAARAEPDAGSFLV